MQIDSDGGGALMGERSPFGDEERLRLLRQALPQVVAKHVAQLDSGEFDKSAAEELIGLIRTSLHTGVCDQVFGVMRLVSNIDDVTAVLPFMTLMFKQIADPNLNSLRTSITDNLVLLIQFIQRCSIQPFRHIFSDLLHVLSELSAFSISGSRHATEQGGIRVHIVALPSFFQHVRCCSFDCQSMICCSNVISTSSFPPSCEHSQLKEAFMVDIGTVQRLEQFHASCTTIVGRMTAQNMYLRDFLVGLPSVISQQVLNFSPDVQEASAFALLQAVRSAVPVPEPALIALFQFLELIATDSFRTATLESYVAALVSLLLITTNSKHARSFLRPLLILLPRTLEFAHSYELKESMGRLLLHLHQMFSFLRLHLSTLQFCLSRPDLLCHLRPVFHLVLSSLPNQFRALSLALNASPPASFSVIKEGCFPIDLISRACWSFFHEFVKKALNVSPSKSYFTQPNALTDFLLVTEVFICFSEFPDSGLLGRLITVVSTWIQEILSYGQDCLAISTDDRSVGVSLALILAAFKFIPHIARILPDCHSKSIIYGNLLSLFEIPFDSSGHRDKITDSIQEWCINAWISLPCLSMTSEMILIDKVLTKSSFPIRYLPQIVGRFYSPDCNSSPDALSLLVRLNSLCSRVEYQYSISGAIGRLFCVLSNRCVLPALNADEQRGLDGKINCSICDSEPHNSAVLPTKTQTFRWTTVSPFLALLGPSLPVGIRSQMASSIFRAICHCNRDDLIVSSQALRALIVDLLFDHHSEVRLATANSMHLLVKGGENDTCPLVILFGPAHEEPQARSNPILRSVHCLVELLVEANIAHGDLDMFRDVVLALSSVGKHLIGTAQAVIVFVLIQQMLQEDVSLRALAYFEVCEIARVRGLTTAQLVRQPYIDETVLRWMSTRRQVCDEICEAFLDVDVKCFLNNALPNVLPGLILDHAEDAIQEIALRLGVSMHRLVVDRIAPVLLRILVDNDPIKTRAAAAIAFLSDRVAPGFRFSELLKQCKLLLLESLIDAMGLDSERENATYALSILVLADSDTGFGDYRSGQISVQPPEQSQISSFCSDYFLMLSDHLNSIIQSPTCTNNRKIQALSSLNSLSKLVGPRLNFFTSKMIATLKMALETVNAFEVQSSVLSVFESFLTSLSPEHLGSCLCQVVVILLSCWHSSDDDKIRKQVVTFLESLLVHNRSQLSCYFSDIPIIPDHPSLRSIKVSVEDVVGNTNVVVKIGNLIRLMDHASPNVREMALLQLKITIEHHSSEIQNLLSNNDSCLLTLNSALLRRCSDPSPAARLICSECIGVLGAIDPAQVWSPDVHRVSVAISSNDQLALILCVDYLSKAVRSSAPIAQNRSMFAIQEILRFVGCRSDTPDLASDEGALELSPNTLRGVEFWRLFPSDLRELIAPCLVSNFFIPERKPSQVDGQTFFAPDIAHARWLAEWTRFLIARSQGSCKPIFDACRGAVVSDVATAKFLLPHLVVAGLCFGSSDDREQIQREILVVLESATTDGDRTIQSCQSSLQTIFDLLDLLRMQLNALPQTTGVANVPQKVFGYVSIPGTVLEGLLNAIPHYLLAQAAHWCGANARALRHFEMHIRQLNAKITSKDLGFLQQLFAHLDDTDGLHGISHLRSGPPTPTEQGRDFESLGQWNNALVCYQEEARNEPENLEHRSNLLYCLLRLGQYENCVSEASALLSDQCQPHVVRCRIASLGISASWRAANWSSLSIFTLQHPDPTSFECGLGKVLLSWRSTDASEIQLALSSVRSNIMNRLAAAAQESYMRAYPFWVQLQSLHGLTIALTKVTSRQQWPWLQTISNMQSNFIVRELPLSLYRLLFEQLDWPEMAGRCWLEIAREARQANEFEQGAYAVLRAQRLQVRNTGIEQAELLRSQGLLHQALHVLEEHLNSNSAIVMGNLSAERMLELSNMTCLVGQYMQQSASRMSESVLSCYRRAISHDPSSGKAHFLWASFSDMLLRSALNEPGIPDKTRRDQIVRLVPEIIHNYGSAVMSGASYVYETLPRIVTLWCDHANVLAPNPAPKTNSKAGPTKTSDVEVWMQEWALKVPAHNWFVVLSQLISRLQNDNNAVYSFLRSVIIQTFIAHPRQCTWLVATVNNFKSEHRRGRITAILRAISSSLSSSALEELHHAQKILRMLIELCTAPVASDLKVMRLPAALRRYLRQNNPCLIIPLQSTLTVAIPERMDEYSGTLAINTTVAPFKDSPVMLANISETVYVLSSKERPRKAEFIGNDGTRHWFLCKIEGEGDMRKNSRMMDVCAVVNRLLKTSPDSRQRRLRLRTFAVLPLREDCGIIEWVPNTSCFRNLLEFYQRDNEFKTRDALKYYGENHKKPAARYSYLVEKFPPAMHRFFLNAFPEPNCWYENRLIFTRSWASWSMTGHIVGLGDRHGENILIDQNNGEAVHVDFDCLFDRGLYLKVPEVVPFRLTPNSVDGMGITRVEGVFRACCQIVLRVLRENREVLQNCLETFVHDPLVEWTAMGASHFQAPGAHKAMSNIERRLAGRIGDSTLPVSVEGYVEHLIREALSPDNLGRMFAGWMPWM